jgi:hypothetical protein
VPKGGLGFQKKGHSVQKRRTAPRPAGDQRSPVGCCTIPDRLRHFHFMQFLFYFFDFFFWKYREWARAFGRIGVQHPHFLKLAPILGSVKCSIFHGDWRFLLFFKFYFPKFRVHLDLHIYRWDFCFMKN